MSNNVQTIPSFSFHNNSIRVQGTTDNPLFCLADVCKVLALVDPSKTVKQIKEEFGCPELNSGHLKDRLGRDQQATFITEPQLYFVMMRSRAKVAREFRQWIVNEVLPSIRKTGVYVSSHKENINHKTYIQKFKDFCACHHYSEDELKMFDWYRAQAIKQGCAIAYAKKEMEENKKGVVISNETLKQMYDFFNWWSLHQKDMFDTAVLMREQSKNLMLAGDNYTLLVKIVENELKKSLG